MTTKQQTDPTFESDAAAQFLHAIRTDRFAEARALLEQHPRVGAENLHAACGAADLAATRLWIERDPSLATAGNGDDAWTPLAYACWSRTHEQSPSAAASSTDIVRLLLDNGADPNSTIASADRQPAALPVLFLACRSHNLGAVRVLLERGANPNDGESIPHSAQDGNLECLELLAQHGANLSERHPHWNNTSLYFLAGHHDEQGGRAPWVRGMRWLLEHGADPNVTSYKSNDTPLHTIARAGRCPIVAALLLDHGADPLAARADGRSPYALAVRGGSVDMIELLRARMPVEPALSTIDRFLGACMQADAASARHLLSDQPALMNELTPRDKASIHAAASLGRADAVQLMLDLGFDRDAEEPESGGTPMHWAAWWGRPDVVRLLLDRDAPINLRDSTFGSSPVAWAAHGSTNCRASDSEYCAVVEMLLDAGAAYAPSVNKWNEPPTTMGSARVSDLFKRWRFGVDATGVN